MARIIKEGLSGDLSNISKVYEDEFGITAYIIPKKDYALARYIPDLQMVHSIYFLVGHKTHKNEDGTLSIKPTIYVGMTHGKPAHVRLYEHYNSKTEKYRDWWEYAIIFTNNVWENEDGTYRMEYLEEVFWILMDREMYVDCNGEEPHLEMHKEYDKNPTKYIDTINRIAQILSFEHCVAFSKSLKEKYDKEKEAIENDPTLSKKKKEQRLSEQQELYGWVIEVITPEAVVQHMVDDIFNHEILPSIKSLSHDKQIEKLKTLKFLDLACKSECEFLEYIAVRLSKELVSLGAFRNEKVASRHIIKDQLYGLTVRAQTLELARYNLFADNSEQAEHIQYIDDYVTKIADHDTYKDNTNKDSGHTKLYREVLGVKVLDNDIQGIFNTMSEEVADHGEYMKFDVVIGNPPYNDNVARGNGGGGNNLYLHFMKKADELTSKYSCLIVPSNWMIQYPQGVSHSLVDEMRTETAKMPEIHDYKDTTQVFGDEVSIPGGVCYYVMDKDKETPETDYYEHTTLDNYDKQTRVLYQKIYEPEKGKKNEGIIIRDGKALRIIENVQNVAGRKSGGLVEHTSKARIISMMATQ